MIKQSGNAIKTEIEPTKHRVLFVTLVQKTAAEMNPHTTKYAIQRANDWPPMNKYPSANETKAETISIGQVISMLSRGALGATGFISLPNAQDQTRSELARAVRKHST